MVNCLNCDSALTEDHRFCPDCGQNASVGRLETSHVVHDFLHAFTHTDKGFFYLVKWLTVKPGIIAREYVEGRRKKYFNPFSFVIIIVALSTFVVSSFDLMSPTEITANSHQPAFFSKHINILIFLSIPLIAFFTNLFFKNKGINYAESVVLTCFTSGERSLFYTLIICPILIFSRQHYFLITYTYLFLYALYYSYACCQYFMSFKVWTFVKAFLASFLAQASISFIIAIGYYIYFSFTHHA